MLFERNRKLFFKPARAACLIINNFELLPLETGISFKIRDNLQIDENLRRVRPGANLGN